MRGTTESTGSLNGRRVVVTGANGFVGAHLIERLLGEGADVVAVVRPSASTWRLQELLSRVRVQRCELADLTTSTDVRDVDVLFHLAAAGTNQSDHDAERILYGNIVGTFHVVQWAERLGVSRVVLAGTGHEYGLGTNLTEAALPRPRTVYAASKVAASTFAHTYAAQRGLDVVTLRTFSLYGGGQARHFLVPEATLSVIAGQPIRLTSGRQVRDYVYVGDAVDAYIRAAVTPGIAGEVFNVASGREIRIVDLIGHLRHVAGSHVEVRVGDVTETATELWQCSGATGHALSRLGWRATTDLDTGLRCTVDWFRQHREIYVQHYPGGC